MCRDSFCGLSPAVQSQNQNSEDFQHIWAKYAKDDGRVVSNFIVQALQNNDITIFGDGTQTRSFCYVSDMIEGFMKMMDSPDEFTGPVNMGNPNEITIL